MGGEKKKPYVGQTTPSLSRDIGVVFPDSLTGMRSRPFDSQAERRIFKLFISVNTSSYCVFGSITTKASQTQYAFIMAKFNGAWMGLLLCQACCSTRRQRKRIE